METPMITLRGHHLMHLYNYYTGGTSLAGMVLGMEIHYSTEMALHTQMIWTQLVGDDCAVQIVAGLDDICVPHCPSFSEECTGTSYEEYDLGYITTFGLKVGAIYTSRELRSHITQYIAAELAYDIDFAKEPSGDAVAPMTSMDMSGSEIGI